ncbi:MAG: hypothetical protein Q7J24_02240 [Desulfomicrobium sp.]|nr:hypothetical protein [Desulfomicrobium sp.]
MMVDNLNLSTLISQIPDAQKIHHTQLSHPETQQALAQELVQRRQMREKNQVAKSESSAAETEVDPEGHQETPQGQHSGKQRKQRHETEFESDQGHLIDTKV